ncbi:alpha/beta fold hydrolase [Desulforudis sp. 1088]|uniref:alpha/beta fold hydrolase n=1 Tax=unclassified Candidatus Desulforudis TaxID=2635950 RepID=UPI003BEE2A6F
MPDLLALHNRIHYEDRGRGEPVIFLHNGFWSSKTWDKIMPLLEEDCRAVAYDRYGFGRSARRQQIEPWLMDDGVAELAAVLEHLGLEKVHLCGHCLGGAVALLFASRYPDRVKSLVAEAVGYFTNDATIRKCEETFVPFERTSLKNQQFMQDVHGPEYGPALWELLRRQRVYVWDRGYNLADTLQKVSCPTLIISGDRDYWFGLEHALLAYERLKAGRLWIVPDCGHNPHIERPQEFALNLRRLLLNAAGTV